MYVPSFTDSRHSFFIVTGPITALAAQVTTTTVYGVVRDSTGATLPGAGVVATNQGTNLSRDMITDERGEFVLPGLPVRNEFTDKRVDLA